MKKVIFILLITLVLFSGCLQSPTDRLVKVDAIKTVENISYPGEKIILVVDGVDIFVTVGEDTLLNSIKLGGINVTANISKKHTPKIFTIGERVGVIRY